MTTDEQKLSLEQKELVAVGASIGAGCHPCVDHHLKAGAKAGIDGQRLLAAVTSAERVTAEAAVAMGSHVRGKLGPSVTEPALLSRLEEALASLGAALGANDATNIERQLRTALELGVSRPELQHAIETAHVVQENAARIHLHEAERLLDSFAESVATPNNATESGDRCGCGAEDQPEAAAEAQAQDAEVECGEGCGHGAQNESEAEAAAATTGPAAGFAGSMPGLFGGVSAGEKAGVTSAMANCRRMFEGPFGPGAAPTEINEPSAATGAAGSCTKEV